MENVSKLGLAVFGALLLAGCAQTIGSGAGLRSDRSADLALAQGESGKRPAARPAAGPDTMQTDLPKPSKSAQTVEQFDTTTSAQRQSAIETAPVGGERKLGATVGSLGNPAEPGFWLKTPLVSAAAKGRVEYPANGKSVAVNLIPIDGPKTAGSRVSLAALRLLGAPLTGLPELVVYVD